jgi:hypothetical protein
MLRTQAGYAGWVTGGDVESEADITPGDGAVLRRGISKVAVYRDLVDPCMSARPSALTWADPAGLFS